MAVAVALGLILSVGACGGDGDDPGGADATTGADAVTDAAPDGVGPDAIGADAAADANGPADADVATDAGPVCDPRVLAEGEVRAKRIVCEDELIGGPQAAGMIGDVLLENARVRFVVRAAPPEGLVLLGLGPGGVVDADRVRPAGEPGQDRLREIFPLVSFNIVRVDEIEIGAGGGAGEASVRMTGEAAPLPVLADAIPALPVAGRITVEYVLRADEDHLTLRTTVAVPDGGTAAMVAATDVLFLAGDQSLFLPGPPRGDGETWNGAFVATDAGVRAEGEAAASYGYGGPDGVHFFDMEGSLVFLSATRPVRPGTELVVERWLAVGDGSPGATVDTLRRLGGEPTGRVRGTLEAPEGGPGPCAYRVVATAEDGDALTSLSACPNATFAGRLPVGAAQLVATCEGCPAGAPAAVTVVADDEVSTNVVAPTPGRLTVDVTDGGGAPLPARLTIVDLDHPERRRLLRFSRALAPAVPLAPGRYRVTVSRGFEYETATREVTVPDGGDAALDVVLERSVATAGAVAAEFHIHSELSADSAVPVPDRVRACAAEGLEFVTPSEHDYIGDYAPTIAALGLEDRLATTAGVEVSSIDAGHHNAWPVTPDPLRAGMRAPDWFDLSPPALVGAIRAAHPDAVVQVNHPRFDYGSAFEIIGFDPATARATVTPESLGFPPETDLNAFPYDAIEVFNGIGDEQLAAQLADWYALLNVGHRITATAGGDSHDLGAYPGNPRNYVLVADDDPATLAAATVAGAVRAMRVVVSSGPYVEVSIAPEGGGGPAVMGDDVTVTGGEVPLAVRVQAPTWMAVDEVRVVANGAVVHTVDLRAAAPDGVVRLDETLPIGVAGDTWLVVEAEGAARDPVAANHPPFAVTNPIFVDTDGDGAFTPPGLPAR